MSKESSSGLAPSNLTAVPAPLPVPATGDAGAPRPVLKIVAPKEALPGVERNALDRLSPLWDDFPSEEASGNEARGKKEIAKRAVATAERRTLLQAVVVVLGVVAAVESLFLLWNFRQARQQAAPTVTIESTPPGAIVTVNGRDHGMTPSVFELGAGEYSLSVTRGTVTQKVPLVVGKGNSSTHIYFQENDTEAAAPVLAATAPLTNSPLVGASPPSPRAALAPPPSAALGGWVSVAAPIDVQLFEDGKLIGTSESERIMLPVGRHALTAVNSTLGYTEPLAVQVVAGSVARIRLTVPSATVNINAAPWAEATVDGKDLGATPLGNVSLPIGPHEVVFSHPALGERRQAFNVSLKSVNRVSVNFNQK